MGTVEFHTTTSRRFMQQAQGEFNAGDVMQASEKGWGAAAHAIKAVAESRGWRHENHGDLFNVARRIADELEQPQVWDLFRVASDQHKNFYEGWLADTDVEKGLARVRELLELLGGALPY